MSIASEAEDEAYEYLRRHGWATDTTVDPVELLRECLAALEYWKQEAKDRESDAEEIADQRAKLKELQDDLDERERQLDVITRNDDKARSILQLQQLLDAYRASEKKMADEVIELRKQLAEAQKPKKRGRPRKNTT